MLMKNASVTSTILFRFFHSPSHKILSPTKILRSNFSQRRYIRSDLTMTVARQDDINWVRSFASSTATADDHAHDDESKCLPRERVSVLSWNILAQCLFEGRDEDYAYVAQDAPVSWPERCSEILRELIERDADVLCLQEVTKVGFEENLLPSLQRQGYDGIMQQDRKWGVATFWKTQRFSLGESAHRSRTMITTLNHQNNDDDDDSEGMTIFGVINCHLQGSPDASVTRVRQLHTALNELRTKFTHHRLIVCGDMNCPLPSSACTTYLLGGDLTQDVFEWGREVTFPNKTIPHHGYTLRSAYPTDLVRNDPTEFVTFVNGPGRTVVALDQIWAHQENDMEVVGLTRPFSSLEQRQKIFTTGLPSHVHPSDHLPVGCILEWTKKAPLVDLSRKPTQEAVAYLSAEEMISQATELIKCCRLEDESDRADLEYIITPITGLEKKTKPTAEQMDLLRTKRRKKQALFEKVSEDTRLTIERAIKLLKDADKVKFRPDK